MENMIFFVMGEKSGEVGSYLDSFRCISRELVNRKERGRAKIANPLLFRKRNDLQHPEPFLYLH